MDGHRNPEIQRVLAALNSFSQQQHQQQHASQVSPYDSISYHAQASYDSNSGGIATLNIPGLGLLPQSHTYDRPITPPSVNRQQSFTPNRAQNQGRVSTPQPPVESLRSKTSNPKYDVPDASTITTWPAALKHVTRHLASNEKVANRVKHLINESHKHEREWWAGREAIVDRHQGKSGTSQQVSAILQSLGAKDVPAPAPVAFEPSTEKKKRVDDAELKAYDEKVYNALCAMTADFDRQLREMGVPFYAIKHELVILKDGPEKTPGEHKGKIDKGELRELQKRMSQTLEDLFGD
jgi:hypothetical protein